jgi:hypothetical protein
LHQAAAKDRQVSVGKASPSLGEFIGSHVDGTVGDVPFLAVGAM